MIGDCSPLVKLILTSCCFFSGDIILAANGPDQSGKAPVGVSLDLATEQLVDVWKPSSQAFDMPHDIAVSADSTSFYVSQISVKSPKKIFKFNII